jgi:basic membrane protein A
MRKRYGFVLVALILTLALAACGGDDKKSDTGGSGGDAAAPAEKPKKKVAFIGIAPVTQGNWDPAGYKAFTAAAEKYNFEPTNQEAVTYDGAAPVLRRLARDNEMVIAHSSGYEAAVMEVAPEFPDVWFVIFSDLSTETPPPNVAGWAINWNELGYMAGTAKCFAAKEKGSDTIGHVNSQPIPAFTRYAGGDKQAAADLGCKWLTVWTNSFEDVAKAKQAALSMINDGAGALSSSADTGDEGSREGAVEGKALFVGNYVPETELAPKNTITSVMVDFDKAYDQMGQLFSDGSIEAKRYDVDVKGGFLSYEEPFSNVGDKVMEQAKEVLAKIESGEIAVDAKAEVKP